MDSAEPDTGRSVGEITTVSAGTSRSQLTPRTDEGKQPLQALPAARSSARSMPSRSRLLDWPALATVTMRLIYRLEIQRRSSRRSSC